MERETELLKIVAKQYETKIKKIINRNYKNKIKSSELSEVARKTGENLLVKPEEENSNKQDQAYLLGFKEYCRSILLAPKDSKQLALGYECRSALLFHIGKYKDCIKNIDCALEISNQPCTFRIELLRRKAKCLQELGIFTNKNVWEDIETLIDIFDETAKIKYIDLINESMTVEVNKTNNPFDENCSSEIKSISDRVEVKCNEEFGRFLVAAQDFEVGNLIVMEKPYTTYLSPMTTYTNCNFCLKTTWSGIPCEFCNWSIFCSKECKNKANELHHEIECLALSSVQISDNLSYVKLCLRTVLISIKEAGSIAELRNKVVVACEFPDFHWKGSCDNGIYYGNLMDFISSIDSESYVINKRLELESIKILELLIFIVRHTKLIENFSSDNIDDWLANEDFMFLASLILKLSVMIRKNHYKLSNKIKACEFGKNMLTCDNNLCCCKGICLSPLTNLIKQSAFPNVTRCCTENNEIKIFAVQPIKKGDQVLFCSSTRIYAFGMKFKNKLLKEYNADNFFCQPSSQETWAVIFKGLDNLEKNISQDYSTIFDVFLKYMIMRDVSSHLEKPDLERLSMAITCLIEKLPQAKKSMLMHLLINSFERALSDVYGMKPLWDKS